MMTQSMRAKKELKEKALKALANYSPYQIASQSGIENKDATIIACAKYNLRKAESIQAGIENYSTWGKKHLDNLLNK